MCVCVCMRYVSFVFHCFFPARLTLQWCALSDQIIGHFRIAIQHFEQWANNNNKTNRHHNNVQFVCWSREAQAAIITIRYHALRVFVHVPIIRFIFRCLLGDTYTFIFLLSHRTICLFHQSVSQTHTTNPRLYTHTHTLVQLMQV